MTGDPSLPIGGTAGLGHTRSGAVDNAAAWLAVLPDAERPRPLVPGTQISIWFEQPRGHCSYPGEPSHKRVCSWRANLSVKAKASL